MFVYIKAPTTCKVAICKPTSRVAVGYCVFSQIQFKTELRIYCQTRSYYVSVLRSILEYIEGNWETMGAEVNEL